jgi:hypothetical protein
VIYVDIVNAINNEYNNAHHHQHNVHAVDLYIHLLVRSEYIVDYLWVGVGTVHVNGLYDPVPVIVRFVAQKYVYGFINKILTEEKALDDQFQYNSQHTRNKFSG